jgi:hypothetical protein
LSPPISLLRRRDTHRLSPTRFGEWALPAPPGSQADLAAIADLERLTGPQAPPLPAGLAAAELVTHGPWAHIVNGAFLFPHPLGSRFNSPDRGAWYGGFERATSIAEVAFHRSVALADIGFPPTAMQFDDWLADFSGTFHDLRVAPEYADCLAPDSYLASQRLAARLLAEGSAGIVYPSVRRASGTCIACFRPGMVQNVRRHLRLLFTWSGAPTPRVATEARY